jgi:uncharacterized protein
MGAVRSRWLHVLALALLLASLPSRAERVSDLPRPSNYVSDFAGVLSPATRQSLDGLCGEVDHEAHAQIAVVTIKSLDGDTIENFATQLEDKWGVGPKGSDRGVLLILAIQDRKRRIEVGYGLEGILPDAKAGEIGRAMVPDLRAGDYDAAVTLAVSQIAQIIAADAGVTLRPLAHAPPRTQPLGIGGILLFLVMLFLVAIFLARAGGSGLLGFLLGMFLGGRGGGGWGGGMGGGGWGGSGGGNGGGAGGFGGFGGGGSGGGGASGSW